MLKALVRKSLLAGPARATLYAYRRRREQRIVRDFHRLYYNADERTWRDTYWFGAQAKKCPLDLWIYQELLFELRPELIVECGTSRGGSALFIASVCDLLDHGEVVTVDVAPQVDVVPSHPRITYIHGSSISEEIATEVRRRAEGRAPIMVILDSEHAKDHVAEELRLYASLVTSDSYLIVEDTNLNGHPVMPSSGPGPAEALQEFLTRSDDFVVDRSREKFFLTFSEGGYLRRR